MLLVVLYGPPGVGKLTVARALAERTGLRVFHNHLKVDLVVAVFAFGSEPFVRLRERIWLAVLREAARRDTSLIFTFAPERTVRARFLGNAARAVRREGGRVVFVELTCEPEELERRIEQPSRAAFGKLRSRAAYRRLRDDGAFDARGLPAADLTLDTSAITPDDAAGAIAAYLCRS